MQQKASKTFLNKTQNISDASIQSSSNSIYTFVDFDMEQIDQKQRMR